MITFEEAAEALDEIAQELPQEIYADLNGGINLLPEEKLHPEGNGDELYIMGEYCYNNLGRYINIFYGSIMRVYAYLPAARIKQKIAEVLKHEFTHHLESMAGEKELAVKDTIDLEKYKRRIKRRR